ncbi:uncharacterized protein prom isoform X2 [Atheta coriaria]|uniref:uncharacterized protein prom isoform X2 n=1 Tax=Dalotia coriaria TaxID=877792 RepID=UPI0031F46397
MAVVNFRLILLFIRLSVVYTHRYEYSEEGNQKLNLTSSGAWIVKSLNDVKTVESAITKQIPGAAEVVKCASGSCSGDSVGENGGHDDDARNAIEVMDIDIDIDMETMREFALGRKVRNIENGDDNKKLNTKNMTTSDNTKKIIENATAVATNTATIGDGRVGGGKAIDGTAAASSAQKLHFPAAPVGERILLDVDPPTDGPALPLSAFSVILGCLQPVAFPLETLREAVQGRLSFHGLLLQATKMEILLVLWSVSWLIAAVYVPYTTLVEICCRRRKFLQRLENHSSASSLEHADNLRRLHDNHNHHHHLQNTCHTLILNILLILLIGSLGLILAGSEQANRSIHTASTAGGRAAVAFEDVERFARNSEMQIAFVTAASLEIALDAIDKDLQDAENLLGKPIKNTFGEFYNLESTFQSLKLIQQDSIEISKTVTAIKSVCVEAAEASSRLQRRLDDLIPLVRNIRQVCAERDGVLCETITENGLVVTLDVKELNADGKLIYLNGISTQTHFNSSLHEAEMNYQDIGRKIALETHEPRAAIRTALDRHRTDIHKQLRVLEDTSRSLITSIKRGGDAFTPYRAVIASWEMWRYLLTFVLVIILFITWMLLLCGTPCCCTQTKISFAILGASLAAIAVILSWLQATAMLLLGVHGETFICRPLYQPNYEIITGLVDNGGVFSPNGSLIQIKLNLNETIRVADVLRAAENNKTVYKAFNLKSLLDIDALTDFSRWSDVRVALERIRVQRELKILSPALENSLLDFTNAGGVNLTLHRTRAARPPVGRDLHSLLDQLYAIAKHVRDVRTKGRLENLTYKLRDIVDNEYKQLNDVQDRLIYHITALDVLLKPLVKRAEQVLVNLTKFQQSMNFELESISKHHVVNYTNRLEDYLAQFRANVLYEIKHRTAKTGPLWRIFAAIRVTLCDGCVDGINALSFGCYLSILILLLLQPVLWGIIRSFRERNEDVGERIRNSSVLLHRSVSEELIHQNPQNWQTPRAGSPDTIVRDLEESVWVSPRQSHDTYLQPPPPRQPDVLTIRTPIGFDRTNWSVDRDTHREVSPALSSTRRWI